MYFERKLYGMKILFLIHDLGQGGAEKVLVNLVNNMDQTRFDITVLALFGGVNEQFLNPNIRLIKIFSKQFAGNSKIMKFFSPSQLHRLFIKEKYDIEIAYLEGPSTRIVSGCPETNTKLVSWIHCCMKDQKTIANGFRNIKEAVTCYKKFDRIVCVSNDLKKSFTQNIVLEHPINVLYNTVDSERIIALSQEKIDAFDSDIINLIAVGTLKEIKGFDRLINIHAKLVKHGFPVHTYLLGEGPKREELVSLVKMHQVENSFFFLGYDVNPYKYISKADLFVCSSLSEGFSTAVTEALIIGTPICTVNVAGMKELLGDGNEYGVVTENDEKALYQGIKRLLESPDLLNHYKKQAKIRGQKFNLIQTVQAVEQMLINL